MDVSRYLGIEVCIHAPIHTHTHVPHLAGKVLSPASTSGSSAGSARMPVWRRWYARSPTQVAVKEKGEQLQHRHLTPQRICMETAIQDQQQEEDKEETAAV